VRDDDDEIAIEESETRPIGRVSGQEGVAPTPRPALFALLPPAARDTPLRRRVEALEAALAGADEVVEALVQNRVDHLGRRWLDQLTAALVPFRDERKAELDLVRGEFELRIAELVEQLGELKPGAGDDAGVVDRIEQIILDERNLHGAAMVAVRAEMAGLLGALTSRVELIEAALREVAQRLRAVEAALAGEAAAVVTVAEG
jgi:hypothetical protein